DMDTAWDGARRALTQASLRLTGVPLFRVLGRPAGGTEALFTAARVPLAVQQTPRRPDAPLHVYASREAVYVTCAETSVLGRQAAVLREATAAPGPAAPALAAPDRARQIQEVLAHAREEGRGPGPPAHQQEQP